MVQEIEHLRAELEIQVFANRRVFEQGKIPGGQAGTDQRVASQVAVESAVVRRRQKRRRIEPLVRRPLITGPVNAGFTNGRTGFRVSPLFDGL